MTPKGWEKKTLNRVAFVQTGLAKGPKRIENPVEVPYLRVANVQDGYLDLEHIKTIKVDRSKISRYSLQQGDVLMTEGGDFDKLGRGAVWNSQIVPCLHQNHVFAVRPHPDVLLSEFLSMLTSSSSGKAYFLSCSKQSTNLASINSSQLKAFPVLLPPLAEQKAIAATLSEWDQAIEKTERLILAKEKRFKWLTSTLINPADQVGWKTVKLGDVLSESRIAGTNGLNAKKISVKLYGKGVFQKNETRKGSANTKYYKRKTGQLIYSKLDFLNGAFGLIPANLDGFESTLDLPAFDVTASCSSDWLLYYFTRPAYYTRQTGLSKGQRKARRVSPTELLNSHIGLPPLLEQKRIAETLNLAQQEIKLLKELAKKQKLQKRGLMQKLLIGAWRVKGEKTHE